ncbi:hypothetical protein FP803_03315 [Candidatus Woesearchaeota archaeon]|nr:hypothetical protein [Candidatus Woesearchaeota archaeon]
MNKRAQITPFIILGLVFLLFFLIILFTKSYRIEKIDAVYSGEISPIKNYVDLCAKSSASDALYLLGVQGGYTAPPKLYFQSAYAKIAYWYYEGQDTSPTIEEMEQELSSYVNRALPECIESLNAFSDMGFEFEFGEIDTETKINENNVEFRIDYSITIIKGESKAEISEFYKMIPVRLGYMYSIAKEIVGKEVEDPDWIDMTYLVNQDLNFKIYPYDENTLIYSVLDNQSIIDYGTQFMFLFANGFKESEELS